MSKDPKQIVICAAKLMSFAAISHAGKSPELTRELAQFGRDTIFELDCDAYLADTTMLNGGPVTQLSLAFARDENADKLRDLIERNRAAIIDNLGPVVDSLKRSLGIV